MCKICSSLVVMQRHHLIELHEQPWYPRFLRHMTQDALGKMLSLLGLQRALVLPMAELFDRTRPGAILDMCSGSAELIVQLCKDAAATVAGIQRPSIVLSDLFPNTPSFERLKQRNPSAVEYCCQSVDARSPPRGAKCHAYELCSMRCITLGQLTSCKF